MHLRLLMVAALGAGMAIARAQSTDPAPPPDLTAKELAQGYRDTAVLAKPRGGLAAAAISAEAASGIAVAQVFDNLGGLRVIDVPAGETPEATVARLQASGLYDFVELDHVKHAYQATPNDPSYPSQWALHNTGSNSGPGNAGLPGADIHAPEAWSIRHDAQDVIVAIIDTGLLLTHTDLAGNLWVNPRANVDGYRNDTNGINATVPMANSQSGNPVDDNGHGTHVAGIIGAVGNNGLAVSGVAWKVQLMPLKFLNASGNGVISSEVACISFAIAHGASVINASFGSAVFDASELAAFKSARDAGVLVVAAAGNAAEDNGLTPNYPANYPLDNIVTVACSDSRDDAAFFSDTGSGNVDLFAPGESILSTFNTNPTATQTLSGTSMSAPMVSGALALLKAQFPSDTPRQLVNRMLRTVDVNPNFAGRALTSGRLNLARALASTDNRPFNDDFAARPRLAGTSVTVRTSNAGAGREPGEPAIATTPGGSSLWWEWTAPTDGTVSVTTAGSAYATLLGVYTGTSLGSLIAVATSAGNGAGGSALTFAARAGTTYEISADGQNGAAGLTILNLGYANDSFDTAEAPAGRSWTLTGTNANATRDAGEPQILGKPGGHSVWYRWTAPASGSFQVTVLSLDFDPLLAVYTGSSLSGLTALASAQGAAVAPSANSPSSACTVTFNATAGTTYRIAVDGSIDATTALAAGQYTIALADSIWQAATGDSVTSAPSVAPDGTVYVGSVDHTFYAFNPDGSAKWTFATAGNLDTASAAVGADGTVYFGSDDGHLYALNPGGTLRWKFATSQPPACGPAVAADGTVYIKDQGTSFYAVGPDGTLRWTAPVPGVSYAPPTIAPDGTIYIGSDDGHLYALTPDGATRWTFAADGPVYTAAAIDAAGNLYFGTLAGTFYSVSASGTQNWSFKAGNSISSSAALGANGSVYFGSYDRKLYALSTADGTLQWSAPLGGEVRANSPAVDAAGTVYIGCYDDNVYAVSASGSVSRVFATAGWVRSSPVIYGTRLFFGSNDHRLYAFDIGSGISGSAWPMHLNNSRRLGRSVSDPLAFTVQPLGQSISTGSGFTLTSGATGQGPLAYQWYRDGVAISGATNSNYTVASAAPSDSGSYTVVVTGPQGRVTSSAAAVSVGPPAAGRLVDIAARANVGTGGNVLTAGFVLSGTGTKNILLRGVGPGLVAFGVPSAVPNPQLKLFNSQGGLLQSNSGWADNVSIASAATRSGAFSLQAGSSDAAILLQLPPGAYSEQVGSADGSPGVALAEVYDADTSGTDERLVNISARANVGAGADVLIAGFVITGNAPKTVLLRGVGPALSRFGVPGSLTHPLLSLFNAAGVLKESNSGWGSNAAISAAASQVGAFALTPGSADAAILVTLPAGAYTVEVSSADGTTGVGLVEVYDVK